jgi:cell division septal protein FtsQ
VKPVTAPADKRFRRAHVSPARRRGWRPSRAALVRVAVAVVLGVLVVYRGVALVFTASALKVAHVTVAGNERMSRGEVISRLEGLEGSHMLTVNLEVWRAKLKGAPWVADATLRRVFPNTVMVVIAEREPMGIGRLNDRLMLVDPEGTIIDEFGPNYATLDLPIIDGLAAGGPTLVDGERAILASRLLAGLQQRPELARLVSQIDVSDARDAAVLLKNDPAVLKVGHERFAERLQAYLELAPALRERVDGIDYVDLRFDQRVYVRPRSRRAGGDE